MRTVEQAETDLAVRMAKSLSNEELSSILNNPDTWLAQDTAYLDPDERWSFGEAMYDAAKQELLNRSDYLLLENEHELKTET